MNEQDKTARMVQHFERLNDQEYTREERRDAALLLIPVFAMVIIGVAAFAVLVTGGL
jgi:hypothetical protein